MKKVSFLLGLWVMLAAAADVAQAYENEVWYDSGSYHWKTFNTYRGSSSNLAEAIQGCISTGNREIHVLCGGNLPQTVYLAPGLTFQGHGNSFNGGNFYHDGAGPIEMYNFTMNNPSGIAIRTSRASNVSFAYINIYGGSIGIRVDSHPSRPYEEGRWVYDLYVQDCRFENTGSHGLETYGVDGFSVYGITARNCGECGVLFNKSINGHVGTVNSYRCCYGGGYAGLRFANTCAYVTVDNCIADECGRGLFILSGSHDITVQTCSITDCSDIGIWLENVVNCRVESGFVNCGVSVSGAGSYANVTTGGGGGMVKRVRNRATGLYLDGMGRTTNGEAAGQWANTTHDNARWEFVPTGSYYYLVNRATGMKLDGYGRTTNGSACAQYSGSTTHVNAQWSLVATGSYYYIVNRGTGMRLDGMGRTANGSDAGQWMNTTHVNAQWQLVD